MIGYRIRYYRKRKNFTQEQLAQGICSVSYLSKFENGAPAGEEIVRLLCERLEISFEEDHREEEVEEVKGLLDEWYIEIQNRNLERAGELNEEIGEKIKDIESPNLSLNYDLFKLRYLLICENFSKVHKLKEKIWQFKDHFTDEQYYYYLNFSGIYFFAINNLQESLDHLKKAETLANKIVLNDKQMAELYYQLGLVYTHLFFVSSSMNYAYKALPIFDQNYNLGRSIDCHILLGISNRRIRNYEQSKYHYENALKLAISTKNTIAEKVLYHNLGYVHASEGKSEEAIKFYKRTLNMDENYVQTIFLIAREFCQLNKLPEAEGYIEKGLQLTKKESEKEYNYHFKILAHQLHKDFGEEYEILLQSEAIPYFEDKMLGEYVAEYEECLGDYYFSNHQYKNAAKNYQMAIQARKKLY